jgi:hypothetical protein
MLRAIHDWFPRSRGHHLNLRPLGEDPHGEVYLLGGTPNWIRNLGNALRQIRGKVNSQIRCRKFQHGCWDLRPNTICSHRRTNGRDHDPTHAHRAHRWERRMRARRPARSGFSLSSQHSVREKPPWPEFRLRIVLLIDRSKRESTFGITNRFQPTGPPTDAALLYLLRAYLDRVERPPLIIRDH